MLLGNEDEDIESVDRIIYLNDPIKNNLSFGQHDNSISTGKYSMITFLPKFLFEQFRRAANAFFLFTAIIQQIPDVSPTSRYTTAIPLALVLLVAAIKEIAEDRKRHLMDNDVNNRSCKVLQGSAFVEKKWKEICVGDIVKIEDRDFFPADIVLMSSSEPDGLCYIETANLDGETNLKIRQGRVETFNITTPEQAAQLRGVIKSEQPNNSLYTYEATLRLEGKEVPLEPVQLLLRGAQLRNTNWAYGIVVSTGKDTKLMRNTSATPIKRTRVEKMMNVQIFFLFIILLCMSLSCAFGTLARTNNGLWEKNILLIQQIVSDPAAKFFRDILTFIILYNNLIPISLIVTVEVVRLFQAQLINVDLDMYYEVSDTPATARTSSLVEELGQIEFIFSDKTGTLTCNMMEYRMCSIGGKGYAQVVPEDKRIRVDEKGTENGYWDFETMLKNVTQHPTGPVIHEFYTLLAVCHTVIPEVTEEDPPRILYQASSPDEGALVNGAAAAGYVFTTRKPRSVIIKANGEEQEFEILNICEFNSTRKRMSAIVRTPEGKIKLYIKGADTVILERLSKTNPGYVDPTLIHLEEYATEGLRTLCIAMREISEEEYKEWSVIYDKAATTINNRGLELDKAAELIEKDLFLLGATAIEDRLQDGVPDTIHTLAQAGIKIWVLTGDRQETAINIGYSCKLITEEMNLIVVNENTHFETKEFLTKKLAAVKGGMVSQSNGGSTTALSFTDKLFRRKKKRRFALGTDGEPLALIIDGRTLDFALEKDIELIFLELACYCKAVICCRVSPLQKALVVKLVKRNIDSVLLAIGDGANDVSMIQAAHVGVGISGMEGLQAARAADFAISQFSYLRKLLLVHGNWSYNKISKLILYSFYKNITLYFTQFWFAMDNGFSGQTAFESWILTGYNAVFAVLPPIVMGIFDNYINARMLDRYPQLYNLGQKSEFFNVTRFWGSTLNAILHSIIIYYFVRGAYGEGIVFGEGHSTSHWIMGITIYASVLTTVTWKAALLTDLWVSFSYLAILGSLAVFLSIFPLYTVVAPLWGGYEYDGIIGSLYGSAFFWCSLILVPVICLSRDFIWKYWKRTYRPKPYHIVQEIQKFNIPDYRPRMEWFRKAVHKARMIQRLKRSRGYAFSQNESGQADLIRIYDTTKRKPKG